jgi:hypothetical protein
MAAMCQGLVAACLGLLPAAPLAAGQEPAPQESPITPEEFSRRLEQDGIRLDLVRREVRVRGDLLRRKRSPAYPIEYGIVVEGGFTHEAFGIVRCTPSLLNACFLALGLEPGLARRRVMKDPLPPREDVEAGLVEPFDVQPPQGDRVFLYVTWEEGEGRRVARAFEDFFVDLRKMQPLPMRGYVYLGSRFDVILQGTERKRVFLADYEGNVVTLHPDRGRAESCLFDVYSFDEEPYLWADVDEEKLPPEGVALEFVFTLLPLPEARPFEPEPPPLRIPLPHARELARSSQNPCLDGSGEEWLDRLGERELVDLAGILKRGRAPLREVAAALLGASRRGEAVDALSFSLRFDRSADVRLSCAYGLAELGSPAALEALIDVLERMDGPPRDDALTALRFASGEDFGLRPLPWRDWLSRR